MHTLGTGARTTPCHSPEWHLGGPHLWVIVSPVHTPDNSSPLAPSHPSETHVFSAVADSRPSPVLFASTLMFNPILTVSSFSPPSRSAGHEYPKVHLLDRIIPSFKATGDDSLVTKKHPQWIFCSLALFLSFSFFCLFLPSVFVPLGRC